MADHAAVDYETASGNDLAQHEATYRGFVQLVKWGVGSTVLVLVLMAIFLV
ncbi:aa3-type cytochrome c oxidase subunit IV [Rhodoplanes elegans]|uniref:Aa3-type cytochrome c oxidase subunit IV n=1 Tax=Rhodoplanes elegans TaxID=29408 RepID=A0A327KGD4_9BRAD|nr:aa3-type cytochrome c oxidase subunit IV [Rhodoplanes elegans]MBK5961407.1 aa3-type cytochrome c oxidase subunit IV [Rhodoplanes elegans]RAI37457.1 aa3-type cytochrome c oxidase subunit IV [Rhodoplanes elegans]